MNAPHRLRLRVMLPLVLLAGMAAAMPMFVAAIHRRDAVVALRQNGATVRFAGEEPSWLRRVMPEQSARCFGPVYLVNLQGTSIDDDGLQPLREVPGVQRLNLNGTRVTDAGLDALAGLSELRALDLSGTAVTDAGLASLARLSRLEYLYLGQTRITDAGLERLVALRRLRVVSIEGTGVTEAGRAAFLRRRPDVTITTRPVVGQRP